MTSKLRAVPSETTVSDDTSLDDGLRSRRARLEQDRVNSGRTYSEAQDLKVNAEHKARMAEAQAESARVAAAKSDSGKARTQALADAAEAEGIVVLAARDARQAAADAEHAWATIGASDRALFDFINEHLDLFERDAAVFSAAAQETIEGMRDAYLSAHATWQEARKAWLPIAKAAKGNHVLEPFPEFPLPEPSSFFAQNQSGELPARPGKVHKEAERPHSTAGEMALHQEQARPPAELTEGEVEAGLTQQSKAEALAQPVVPVVRHLTEQMKASTAPVSADVRDRAKAAQQQAEEELDAMG